jgi:hypothetical protein
MQHIHLCSTIQPAEYSNNDSHDTSKTLTTNISERREQQQDIGSAQKDIKEQKQEGDM